MTLQQYYTEAIKFAIYPEQFNREYPLTGLGGEFGEVMDKIKKVWRDNNGVFTDESRKAVAKELGDVCWYIMACARDLNFKEYILDYHIEWYDNTLFELLGKGSLNIGQMICYGSSDVEVVISHNNAYRARVVLNVVHSIAVEIGYTIEQILQMNIDKLTARSEQGKLGGSGDDREEVATTKQIEQ